MAAGRLRERPLLREVGTPGRPLSSYPSRGLTPERLAAVFREADQGNVSRQAELFQEMEEKDAHLAAVLQTRKLAAAGLAWEVAPAGAGEEDERVAAFVREALRALENWDEALLDVLDAVGKGFSVLEIIWEVAGGRVLAKRLAWRHQKNFTFMGRGGRGVLETPRLLTAGEPVQGEELAPNKFVVHRVKARSGAASRGGILRPCAYMYLFKNYTLKDWVVFNERFAQPLRVGKYSPGASEEERRVLRNAVFNLGTDAAAVISDQTVIEFLDVAAKSQSAELYEGLAAFTDRAVSKAVLGQTLTTEQAGGAYATAKVHQEVRRDILEADARALGRTLTMQLIRPLVEFNFGPGTPLPHLSFQHEEGEDLKALAETLSTLRGMGVEIPDSFIRSRFGIPAPEKGAE
ncbi:MAG: DUF935 domain-containing protein [Nitrospirota bacterium]|jgi:phage gp29-like protein